MNDTLPSATGIIRRFTGYVPPDPEESGLTPRQIAERAESRRLAFRLNIEAQMTPDLAEVVVRTPCSELERRLDITGEDAAVVRELALRELARRRTWSETEINARTPALEAWP